MRGDVELDPGVVPQKGEGNPNYREKNKGNTPQCKNPKKILIRGKMR